MFPEIHPNNDDSAPRRAEILPSTSSLGPQAENTPTIHSTQITSRPRTLAQTPDPTLLYFIQQAPIRASMVKRENLWVFEYRTHLKNRYHTAFYTMRCPASCDEPVFSKNPLRQNRAAKHLRFCGKPFRNQKDMVRRYSQLGEQDNHPPFILTE